MKRTDENLKFIIDATKEITHTIHVRVKSNHRLTLEQCEQLHVLERARKNAYCNLNQNKMRKFGKG